MGSTLALLHSPLDLHDSRADLFPGGFVHKRRVKQDASLLTSGPRSLPPAAAASARVGAAVRAQQLQCCCSPGMLTPLRLPSLCLPGCSAVDWDVCRTAVLELHSGFYSAEKRVSSSTSAHSTLPPPHLPLSLPPHVSTCARLSSLPLHAGMLFLLLSFKELWGVEDSLGFPELQ